MDDKDPSLNERLHVAERDEMIRDLQLRAELKAYTDESYRKQQVVFYHTRDKLALGIGMVLLTLLGASWAAYEVFDEQRDRITALEYHHTDQGKRPGDSQEGLWWLE